MFQVNSLGEASFDEADIFTARSNKSGAPSSVFDYAATRVSLGNLKTEVFSILNNFAQTPGSFSHDGKVYDSGVDTLKHAIEEAYVRTDLVENGYDNFVSGLNFNESQVSYNVHVASRTGGLASIESAGKGDAVTGEDVLIIEPFTVSGRNFILGETFTLSGASTINENGTDYTLESGKFKKKISVSASGEYEHGTTLVIKSTPLSGYGFLKWEQGGETDSIIAVSPTDNFYIEATFQKL